MEVHSNGVNKIYFNDQGKMVGLGKIETTNFPKPNGIVTSQIIRSGNGTMTEIEIDIDESLVRRLRDPKDPLGVDNISYSNKQLKIKEPKDK